MKPCECSLNQTDPQGLEIVTDLTGESIDSCCHQWDPGDGAVLVEI